jgi:hypothetical protein
MQKYLWGGAALIVAMAAACYVGVDYVTRHPDSFLARCCGAAHRASMRWNPMSVIKTVVTGEAAPAPQVEAGVAEATPIIKQEKPVQAAPEQAVEPIQVETVPPDAVENPEFGWIRIDSNENNVDFSGVIVPTEEPIQPMPYADEESTDDVNMPEVESQDDADGREMRQCPPMVTKKKWIGLMAARQGEECEGETSWPNASQEIPWPLGDADAIKILGGVVSERKAEELPVMPEEEPQAAPTQEVMPPMTESSCPDHQGCPYMRGCPYCPSAYPTSSCPTQEVAPAPMVEEESSDVEYDTPSLRRLRNYVKKVSFYEKVFQYGDDKSQLESIFSF